MKAHITKEARREVYEYVSKAEVLDRDEMERTCPHFRAVKTRQHAKMQVWQIHTASK